MYDTSCTVDRRLWLAEPPATLMTNIEALINDIHFIHDRVTDGFYLMLSSMIVLLASAIIFLQRYSGRIQDISDTPSDDTTQCNVRLVGGLEHFFTFPDIGHVIIPSDELIFFRGG